MSDLPQRIAPELTERAALADLAFLRGNARRGDHAFIRESLAALGQAEPLVVNRGTHTGVPREIVAGNNRARVMLDAGWTQAAVVWVDVADDTELHRLAVALNKAGDRAGWDNVALLAVLEAIHDDSGDLAATGHDDAALDDLRAHVEELPDLPDDEPPAELQDTPAVPARAAVPAAAREDMPAPAPAAEGAPAREDVPAPAGEEVAGPRTSTGVTGRKAAYESAGTHSVILTYPNGAFAWLVEQLGALGREFELPSNAEVVARLVADATGTTPPAIAE